MADRLADRYRHSRGTTPEDLRQTARAGLIAAIDRYDPGDGNPFVAYAVACVVRRPRSVVTLKCPGGEGCSGQLTQADGI